MNVNYGTTAERVARGIDLLDREVPGWLDRIDVDALDVAHPRRCPAAQATGLGYAHAVHVLGLDERTLVSLASAWHGFNAIPVSHTRMRAWSYVCSVPDELRQLTDEWRRAIVARRAVAEAEALVAWYSAIVTLVGGKRVR